MRHIQKYKIFESYRPNLEKCEDINDFKNSFVTEFRKKDVDWDSKKFKIWDEYFDEGTFDQSRYLVSEGKIIGGCLIFEANLPDYWNTVEQNPEKYQDIRITTDPRKFENKSGIYLEYIFVKPEYRNSRYSKMMIDYIQSLGYDYMWEMSVDKVASKFWLEKIKRDVMASFLEEDGEMGRTWITYKNLR